MQSRYIVLAFILVFCQVEGASSSSSSSYGDGFLNFGGLQALVGISSSSRVGGKNKQKRLRDESRVVEGDKRQRTPYKDEGVAITFVGPESTQLQLPFNQVTYFLPKLVDVHSRETGEMPQSIDAKSLTQEEFAIFRLLITEARKVRDTVHSEHEFNTLLSRFELDLSHVRSDKEYVRLFLSLGGVGIDGPLMQVVARQWIKQIEQQEVTYADKMKRYNDTLTELGPGLMDFVKKSTEPCKKPPFGYSIRELLARGEVPAVRWGTLDLSGKNIISLDGLFQIDNIRTVRYLRLSNNNIKDVKGYFGRLSNLESLWLNGNSITDVKGAFLTLQKLRSLRLSDNGIACVQGAFRSLGALEDLSLYNNCIDEVGSEFDALLDKKEFRSLELGGNLLPQRYLDRIEGVMDQRDAERGDY